MNPYIEKVKTYLSEIEPSDSAEPIWEMLYWCYTERHPINNARIRKGFRDLDTCLPELTIEQSDHVTNLISMLCLEHEKAAFYAGLQAGTRLVLELEGEGTDCTTGISFGYHTSVRTGAAAPKASP